jgi:electron transport complex protein RnfC
MIKRPFFSSGKLQLRYSLENEVHQDVKEIALSKKVTFFLKTTPDDLEKPSISTGKKVKTGEELTLTSGNRVTSTVTGKVLDISPFIGYSGQSFISLAIEVEKQDLWDDEFKKVLDEKGPEEAFSHLGSLPGIANPASFADPENKIKTIIINGLDRDLLTVTNQFIVKTETEPLAEGIKCLKKITGADRIILAVPASLGAVAGKVGADVKVIDPVYPNTIPSLLIESTTGIQTLPGMDLGKKGIEFISAEAVAALGNLFTEGKTPIHKVLTVIDKNENLTIVRARIGTPAKEILSALNIEMGQGDRLVFGGPMTGKAVYSEEMPVQAETDAIMIQDSAQIIPTSDDPCINCGECVRACPANVPVNMLIRLLENSLYEEAEREYDLFSCIECGICSYVCEMRIPIFHYIMLGKHEIALTRALEESNG